MSSTEQFFLAQESLDEFLRRLRLTHSSKTHLSIDDFVHFLSGFKFAKQLPDHFLVGLFEALSEEGNIAELRRLAVACSLFCKEEGELWMEKLLRLYQDPAHPIKLGDAISILTSLFTAYFLLIPSASERLKCSADQFAYKMVLSYAKEKIKSESLGPDDLLTCFQEGIRGLKEVSPFLIDEDRIHVSEGRSIFRELLQGVDGQEIVLLLQTYLDEEGILTFASFLFALETVFKRKTQRISPHAQLALDSIIRGIFEVYDHDLLDAVLFEDIVCGLLLFTHDSATRKAEILSELYCPDNESRINRTVTETTIEAVLRLVVAMDPDFLVGTSFEEVVEDLLSHINATIEADDHDIPVSMFQYWVSFIYRHFGNLQFESRSGMLDPYEGYVYEDESEDQLAKIDDNQVLGEMENARDILHLQNISSSELMEIVDEYSTNGEISKDDFLLVVDLLTTLHGDEMEGDKALQLGAEIFDYFDENDIVDSKEMLCGLILLTDSSPIDKLAAVFGLLKPDGELLSSYEMQQLFLHCLRVVMCCSRTAAGKLESANEELEDLARHAMITSFRFLGLSPLENIDFDGLKRIADRCVALSYT